MFHTLKRLATITAACLACSAAHALAPKTFLSSGGSDAADCSSGAPCATFNRAINAATAGGEVICLNSGAFGPITASKSIVINCLGTTSSNTVAIQSGGGISTVNIGASDRVVLRGIDIQNDGTNYSLRFFGAGTLILDQMKITNDQSNSATPLLFEPTGVSKLVVTDSIFTSCCSSSSGAGIRVVPQGSATAQVLIKNSKVSGNAFGIAIDGSNSTGGINATIIDSVMSANVNDGIVATSSPSTAPAGVTVINSQSINNGFGVRSIGSNITVRVEGSKIIGNGTGLSGGGALLSGGGNTVQGNASNGGFTGTYALQ